MARHSYCRKCIPQCWEWRVRRRDQTRSGAESVDRAGSTSVLRPAKAAGEPMSTSRPPLRDPHAECPGYCTEKWQTLGLAAWYRVEELNDRAVEFTKKHDRCSNDDLQPPTYQTRGQRAWWAAHLALQGPIPWEKFKEMNSPEEAYWTALDRQAAQDRREMDQAAEQEKRRVKKKNPRPMGGGIDLQLLMSQVSQAGRTVLGVAKTVPEQIKGVAIPPVMDVQMPKTLPGLPAPAVRPV